MADVLGILRRHGATAPAQTGGHVHVGTRGMGCASTSSSWTLCSPTRTSCTAWPAIHPRHPPPQPLRVSGAPSGVQTHHQCQDLADARGAAYARKAYRVYADRIATDG